MRAPCLSDVSGGARQFKRTVPRASVGEPTKHQTTQKQVLIQGYKLGAHLAVKPQTEQNFLVEVVAGGPISAVRYVGVLGGADCRCACERETHSRDYDGPKGEVKWDNADESGISW